jgi:pimeloyl-ACP methyl ester carboxylesterase
MSAQKLLPASQYIAPLEIMGLHGRLLHKPAVDASKKEDTLFVYGQHSSIERWWGLIQELSQYGSVTVPDLPGYGGMESLYKIGKQPTFDELADYLASFVQEYYGRKPFRIVGLSIGFAIVTRMLQRHPRLTAQVTLLVSVVGFAHHEDFIFSKFRRLSYVFGSKFFSIRPLDIVLNDVKEKFDSLTGENFQRTMDMELELWKVNDVRTWMCSNIEMFKLDNTQHQVNLPVLHLSVRKDRYFDDARVEKHYRQIFSSYQHVQLDSDSHGPSVIATAEEAAVLIPPELRDMLSKR